ncbi:MAG: CDP-glucose 4,6-dehydratase [Candidatus Wallbacteria bacterium]|nr:CDP-glucose 4,6-dehydratase [Candidatus Wallbacteria bacterium]
MDFFRDRKVLITGNTGFKGSWLTAWLVRAGAKVYGVSKDVPSSPSMFETLNLERRIIHYVADIRDLRILRKIISDIQPEFVFHLAAQAIVSKGYADPIETFSSNIMGTANLLESLRELAYPCAAVIVSSDKCYENKDWDFGYRENDRLGGRDVYSASKGAAEIVFSSYSRSFFGNLPVKIASVRAGNVIGGGDWAPDRLVPDCVRAWSKGEPVLIRNPQSVRPWQHVLEPLRGYLLLAEALFTGKVPSGESFNFGPQASGNLIVETLVRKMSEIWGFDKPENAYRASGGSFQEANILRLNCDKAFFRLGWHPLLLQERMISNTCDWYKAFYLKKTDLAALTDAQIDDYQTLQGIK